MNYRRCLYLLIVLLTDFQLAVADDLSTEYQAQRLLSSEKLMQQGRHYYSQRESSKALACFTIVSERQVTNEEEARLQVRALNNCACVYKYNYFDYRQAYNYFIKAYDLCIETKYDEFLPTIMVNLGDLLSDYSINYNSKPLAEQAQEMFNQCIEKAVKSKNWELLTTAFFNLANLDKQLDLKKYRVIFSKEIPDTTPDIAYVRLQYHGIQHFQRQEYAKARQYFEQQLQVISTQWEPERDSLATFIAIANTYSQEKQYQQAVIQLKKALQLTIDKNITDQAASIYQLLSDNYRMQGDEETASQYHIRYLEKREETHTNQLSNIAEMNYIYKLKKEEEHTQLLEQRQFLQQMALLAGLIILFIVLVFFVLLWRKNKELEQRNRSLYEKNKQVMRIEADEQNLRKTYSKSNLNDERRETLIFRIQEVLADPDIICQQDFTLNKLAKLINSNTTYVSQVINEKYGMTFSNLLGSYRIKVACQWMEDPKHSAHITIETIAKSIGFKSRTAFVNVFKRETGLKPSEYLRMASKKENAAGIL